ncbi:carboxypeptidase-like regulatory domain-containing protein, partial [Singulisphaera rosea]
ALTAILVTATAAGLVARAETGEEIADGPRPSMTSAPPAVSSKMTKPSDKDLADRPSAKPLVPSQPLQAAGVQEIRDYEFKGIVVDPVGKPAEGARLRLSTDAQNNPPRATTAPDGRFRFTVRGPSTYKDARVIAEADGYVAGTASKSFLYSDFPNTDPSDAGRELSVTLTADQPIEGRLVDLEGRPVADADVKVGFLFGPPGGDLTPWLDALKAREGPADDLMYKYMKRVYLFDRYPSQSVKTDAQGRFRLPGLGRDRLAIVKIEASTIRPLEIKVVTRRLAPFQAMNHPQVPQFGSITYYGASLQLAASPTRPIQGIVRDQSTGRPIAGASIQSTKLADREVWNDGSASTTSDAEGRYRLTGMPRGAGNVIIVGTPAGPPYLPVQLEVQNPPGLDPIALDVELTKGVGIEGQVLDLRTRKPVGAWVAYHAAADNKNLDTSPGFKANAVSNSPLLRVMTPPDGRFKLVGLPGRGALVVESQERRYPGDNNGGMPRFDYVPSIQGFHQALVSIDIPMNVVAFRKDIPLDSGKVVEGTVIDPEGRPLDGARAYGLQNLGYWETLAHATFQVVALKSPGAGDQAKGNSGRSLVFLHESRKLAASVTLNGEVDGPIRVKLEPWAAAEGRVIDPEGKPRPNLTLQITAGRPRLGGGQISHEPERLRTDLEGRFAIVGLAPNLDYSVYVQAPAGLRAKKRIEIPPTASGESRDLGTITVEYRND